MTALTLGTQPLELEVILNLDADFNCAVRRADGTEWPDGSTLKLIFTFGAGDPVEWTASYSGDTATWSQDKAVVDAVGSARPRKVVLYYVEGQADLLWATGTVTVNR